MARAPRSSTVPDGERTERVEAGARGPDVGSRYRSFSVRLDRHRLDRGRGCCLSDPAPPYGNQLQAVLRIYDVFNSPEMVAARRYCLDELPQALAGEHAAAAIRRRQAGRTSPSRR
jgi:hypothetical protein